MLNHSIAHLHVNTFLISVRILSPLPYMLVYNAQYNCVTLWLVSVVTNTVYVMQIPRV
jgi:hypothetical protein